VDFFGELESTSRPRKAFLQTRDNTTPNTEAPDVEPSKARLEIRRNTFTKSRLPVQIPKNPSAK
jgi:hypothetical protein